jgi:hypothetical protein
MEDTIKAAVTQAVDLTVIKVIVTLAVAMLLVVALRLVSVDLVETLHPLVRMRGMEDVEGVIVGPQPVVLPGGKETEAEVLGGETAIAIATVIVIVMIVIEMMTCEMFDATEMNLVLRLFL